MWKNKRYEWIEIDEVYSLKLDSLMQNARIDEEEEDNIMTHKSLI